jgi:LacI family transcriptional regulator
MTANDTNSDSRDLTILDVARAASVSKSTVSRVLNGSPHVAGSTRERVLEAVSKLDFRANNAARGLRTTRSRLIGLMVPAISNDVFSRIAEVIEENLRHSGVGLVIASSGWNGEGEQLSLESLRERSVDGLVVSLMNEHEPSVRERLASLSRPVVLLDREVPGLRADVVLTDQRAGIEQALEHLAELGHQQVGLATISQDVRPGREARSSFVDSAERLGLAIAHQVVVPYERIDRRSGWEIAEQMVGANATAILSFVPNSVTAGVLEYLDQNGLNVPEDVSLVAFDESELASVKRPQLTVVSRPIDDLALTAARMITSRLEQPGLPPRVETVRTSLKARGSTAAPNQLLTLS